MRLRSTLSIALLMMAMGSPISAVDLLYVSLGGSTIVSYDTTCNSGSSIANTKMNNSQGLAFDSSGHLYATNTNDSTMSKFNSSGTLLTCWKSGTATHNFLAIHAFPKPSSDNLSFNTTGFEVDLVNRLKFRTRISS
jgi:hypothetical protein